MQKYLFTIFTLARILFKRYLRDRTAIFFTIVFPLIFLIIFGSLFNHSNISLNVDVINQSTQPFSQTFITDLGKSNLFKVTNSTSLSYSENRLNRSQIDGILVLPNTFGTIGSAHKPAGVVEIYYDQGDEQTAQALQSLLNGFLQGINTSLIKYNPPFTVTIEKTNNLALTYFDFLFSGMLGFTIIILGLLGPSQSIVRFKQQGILRRIHTSPISSLQYIIASLLSNIIVACLSIAIMFFVGFHFYHLHMIGNWPNLIIFIIFSIIVIYGIGLAIGGWAKSEQSAAPLTNLVSFPMMFLSGTFFPTYLMPLWLQSIAKFLPLTPVIDGLRYIISQGKTLVDLGPQLLLLAAWMVIIYAVAFSVFRWE